MIKKRRRRATRAVTGVMIKKNTRKSIMKGCRMSIRNGASKQIRKGKRIRKPIRKGRWKGIS